MEEGRAPTCRLICNMSSTQERTKGRARMAVTEGRLFGLVKIGESDRKIRKTRGYVNSKEQRSSKIRV